MNFNHWEKTMNVEINKTDFGNLDKFLVIGQFWKKVIIAFHLKDQVLLGID